ncbi:MAG: DUF1874 domain-containing protein [Candidatus Nezhaarchaeales archaeon]
MSKASPQSSPTPPSREGGTAGVRAASPGSEASGPTLYLASAFALGMIEEPIALLKVVRINTEDAQRWLRVSKYVSIVGHESTANLMSTLLSLPVSVNRANIKLKRGDRVIVFQIMTRLPEGKVLTEEELKSIPTAWYLVEVVA